MADLYGNNEPEDISSFLQILLHNSSSSAAAADSTTTAAAEGGFFNGGGPAAVAESSSSINFSDPNCFLAKDSDGMNPSRKIKNFTSSFEGSEASEFPVNPAPPRPSSKRSRAAEVHNLSEKRRRSRINEKLKALQTLIPNSNKTDKASMLDEAIEYLKQLQLQVQMLTVRNGLSLHPGYSLGSLQSVLGGPSGLESGSGNVLFDANTNQGMETHSRDQDVFLPETKNIQNASTQPMLIPALASSSHPGIPQSFAPPMQNHYGLLNHLASSKDDTLSRLQLDISFSGDTSSPGLSSQ